MNRILPFSRPHRCPAGSPVCLLDCRFRLDGTVVRVRHCPEPLDGACALPGDLVIPCEGGGAVVIEADPAGEVPPIDPQPRHRRPGRN